MRDAGNDKPVKDDDAMALDAVLVEFGRGEDRAGRVTREGYGK